MTKDLVKQKAIEERNARDAAETQRYWTDKRKSNMDQVTIHLAEAVDQQEATGPPASSSSEKYQERLEGH